MSGPRLAFALCMLAALAPFARTRPAEPPAAPIAWPAELDGCVLRERPLSPRDRAFAAEFPGRVGSFEVCGRSVLLRWTTRPTRLLHSSTDCLRGLGYAIEPGPLAVDARGRTWGTAAARLGAERLLVRERIVDANGQEFSDVSSWYWAALLGRSSGPWWATTELEARR